MAMQASVPVPVHGKGHDGTPAKPAGVAVDRLDLDLAVEAADPAQLLAYHGGLELALSRQAGVLPVTAAAAAGPGIPARGRHPVWRRLEDLDRVGPGKSGRRLGDCGPDALAGQGVPQEYHPGRIILPGNAPAAMHDLAGG